MSDYISTSGCAMSEHTRSAIQLTVKDTLNAKKKWPSLYTDESVLLMAIRAAAEFQPEAPVGEVYQAARAEIAKETGHE